MKRIVISVILLACLLVPLAAQENKGYQKRDIYTKTFPIAKLWSSKYGYRVDYVNDTMDIRLLYLKRDYFTGGNASKAVLALGRGPEYPYLSVTWIDGEIDHVTIYAVDNAGDYTWGVLSESDKYQDKFTDDIDFKF